MRKNWRGTASHLPRAAPPAGLPPGISCLGFIDRSHYRSRTQLGAPDWRPRTDDDPEGANRSPNSIARRIHIIYGWKLLLPGAVPWDGEMAGPGDGGGMWLCALRSNSTRAGETASYLIGMRWPARGLAPRSGYATWFWIREVPTV